MVLVRLLVVSLVVMVRFPPWDGVVLACWEMREHSLLVSCTSFMESARLSPNKNFVTGTLSEQSPE